MPKSIWDFCHLDSSLLKNIEQLNRNDHNGNNNNTNNNTNKDQQNLTSKNDVNDKVVVISSKTDNDEIYALQNSIIESERICHESIVEVNTLLSLLTSIDDYYDDVTKQTNTLMLNCEQLLEQQHNYQQTVDILKVTHDF